VTRRLLRTGDELQRLNGNRRTLSRPVLIVQIVKAAAEALVEDVGAAEGERPVRAHRPAGRVDCTGLGWLVELELEVGRDVAGAADRVGQHATRQCDLEAGVGLAGNHCAGGDLGGGAGSGGYGLAFGFLGDGRDCGGDGLRLAI
jgi:hypothetical protein